MRMPAQEPARSLLPDGQVEVHHDRFVELLPTHMGVSALHDRCVDDARLLPAHPPTQRLPVAARGLRVVAAQPDRATADLGINGDVRAERDRASDSSGSCRRRCGGAATVFASRAVVGERRGQPAPGQIYEADLAALHAWRRIGPSGH